MIRRSVIVLTVVLSLLTWTVAGVAAGKQVYPDTIPLPDGFYPEGIAVGRGHDFYAASLLDGTVLKGDLRSGAVDVLTPGDAGRLVAGLSFDKSSGLLWGAGVGSGEGKVFAFDGKTGQIVAAVHVPGLFLNDLVTTSDWVYITDSFNDVLWRIPLDPDGLPAGAPTSVQLSGDFTFIDEDDVGPGEFPVNLNGIEASRDGRVLIAMHTALGVLYRIDPETGFATTIDLAGDTLPFGDGIALQGRTLYVVQNFLNKVGVVELGSALASGQVQDPITSALFRTPTTTALFGDSLYLVNARFDVSLPPALGGSVQELEYEVVRVDRN